MLRTGFSPLSLLIHVAAPKPASRLDAGVTALCGGARMWLILAPVWLCGYIFIFFNIQLTPQLAFTRYSFTSMLSCTNKPSFHCPRPPALPNLLQYDCTIIGQYKTPLPTSRVYGIRHTILVITISCKGQHYRR